MKKDFDTIEVDIRDDVVILTMNNPPVNQLSLHFGEELDEAITAANGDDSIKAIVLTGTDKNFIAGADIKQIQTVKTREDIYSRTLQGATFVNSLETGPKPLVSAINGNALGGGLETALATHYRIAVPGANLGLPEVNLGLLPGAGGTQRLPRLIGLNEAMTMILSGKPIKAERALQLGLVDEVVPADRLIDAAVKAAKKFINRSLNLKSRMTRNMNSRLPSAGEQKSFCAVTRQMLKTKAKGYFAPFKIVDAIEKGLSFDIEKDIKREVGLFADCAMSDVAENLIGIFLNTRATGKLSRIKEIEPGKIKKVAMLGGGVMGSGIVNLLLKGGFEAVLWDINDEALKKGLGAVQKTFAHSISKRKMIQADLDNMIDTRLTTTTSLKDLKDVDLIIEAVLEDIKVKQDIWKKLEGICRPEVIFGTNTSALPIMEIAGILEEPGRMIGLHFFNPADRMQLLEIICSQKTSDQTLATSVAFAGSIKKTPIVVNDGPGFYVSRQLINLMVGSTYLTADGVDGEAIEQAMLDFGMPMGPMALGDLAGIDIGYRVARTFERELGDRYKLHPLTEQVYQTGCYGRKTGSGYYDYSGPEPVLNPVVQEVTRKYLEDNKVSIKEMPTEEIQKVMLALGINEAALMIEQGICDRPQDMDLAMIYGTGFPPYRGGILRYADSWGLKHVYEKLIELTDRYGKRFEPADLVKEMAESGKTFYQN